MKLVFEKNATKDKKGYGTIKESFFIHVQIDAITKVEERISYAVQNMAYSLGFTLKEKKSGGKK